MATRRRIGQRGEPRLRASMPQSGMDGYLPEKTPKKFLTPRLRMAEYPPEMQTSAERDWLSITLFILNAAAMIFVALAQ